MWNKGQGKQEMPNQFFVEAELEANLHGHHDGAHPINGCDANKPFFCEFNWTFFGTNRSHDEAADDEEDIYTLGKAVKIIQWIIKPVDWISGVMQNYQ